MMGGQRDVRSEVVDGELCIGSKCSESSAEAVCCTSGCLRPKHVGSNVLSWSQLQGFGLEMPDRCRKVVEVMGAPIKSDLW